MLSKFRVWMKSLKWMCDVTNISFDSKFVDICQQGDIERYTEMSVEFDEVELMQSTGLKDKDGQEIFEGDIVKRDGVKRPEIVRFGEWTDVDSLGYKEQYIGFYFESEHEGQEWLHSVQPQFNHLYKVIGNIYENPELLEDKE